MKFYEVCPTNLFTGYTSSWHRNRREAVHAKAEMVRAGAHRSSLSLHEHDVSRNKSGLLEWLQRTGASTKASG